MAEQMYTCAGPSVFRGNFGNSVDNSGPSVSSPARAGPVLTEDEQWVVMQLAQVFPHLSQRALRAAVTADNQAELLARHILLNRCIDSLLDKQASPVSVSDADDTDDDDDVPTGDSTMEDLPEDIVDLTTYSGVEVGNQGDTVIDADAHVERVGVGAKPKKLLLPAPVLITDSSEDDENGDDRVIIPGTPGLEEPELDPQDAPPAPVAPQPPTIEEQQADTATQVMEMFPDVEAGYVRELVTRYWHFPHPLNVCCDYLLEHPDYPKAPKVPQPAAAASKSQDKTNQPDYFKEYSSQVSHIYRNQVLATLQNEYRRISVKDLRTILCFYKFHYAPAKKFIQENILAKLPDAQVNSPQPRVNKRRSLETQNGQCDEVQVSLEDERGPHHTRTFTVRLLKLVRVKGTLDKKNLCKELKEEMAFVEERTRQQKEEADHLLALRLNEEQYEAAGQMIECGCCYGEVTFEDMVQCYDGHLFCVDCLKNYTKEKVFGSGQASLSCMTDGCDSTFPMGQLEKALPENMLKKYEERLEEENINLAGLDDLVRCPSCDYGAILAEGDKVFRCQNPECMKQTCRHCKEDWAEHFGIPCKEVERADDTKFRTSIEEKMTEAKIRTCHQCKASFTKHDGCNKTDSADRPLPPRRVPAKLMTCRCLAKMCYVCRKPIKDYNHFCRHARNPGEPCQICTACSLWTSTEEDDERAMEEIQKAAREQKKAEGKDRVADRLGPPPSPKRPRVEVVPPGAGPPRPPVVGQNQPAAAQGVPMQPGNNQPQFQNAPPRPGMPAWNMPPHPVPHFGPPPHQPPHRPVNIPGPPHHAHPNLHNAHGQVHHRMERMVEMQRERQLMIHENLQHLHQDLHNLNQRLHQHQHVVAPPMHAPPPNQPFL
ncbi:hypothetical protein Bbelb_087650 [Branchiostoma belcheri]|nr:hypothetical protein Bbelb_087650 [Branchiostoma belcheri]